MRVRERLARSGWSRRLVLRTLAHLNPGDIRIAHHWVPDRRVLLHSFRHRNYWFRGRDRERDVVMGFRRLIGSTDTVLELGGHIGYTSLIFSYLVGPRGNVVVFEPGTNNLPYLRANTADVPNVRLVEAAAGRQDGWSTFVVEELTGQNNSLVPDYGVLAHNEATAGIRARRRLEQVRVRSVDSFVQREDLVIDFVKIDVEGAEREVVHGMAGVLRHQRPRLMIEMTRDVAEVQALLRGHDYVVLDENLHPVVDGAEPVNAFCLHSADPLLRRDARSRPDARSGRGSP